MSDALASLLLHHRAVVCVGNNDSFAALSCADGQHPRRSGTNWGCSDAFTRTEADNRFTRLTSCTWVLNNVCTAGQICAATCPSGNSVVSGGCDLATSTSSTVMESYPGPSSGNDKTSPVGPWPFGVAPSDPNIPVIDQWKCRAAVGTIDIVYAFCCPAR
jgi:hypothetical protein